MLNGSEHYMFMLASILLLSFSIYFVAKREATNATIAAVLACLFFGMANLDQVKTLAMGAFRLELRESVKSAIQSLNVYNNEETATLLPDRATPATVKCNNSPTDIAVSYGFARIENPNLGPVSIQEAKELRDEKSQRQIGYTLSLYNGAGSQRPAAQVRVFVTCLNLSSVQATK